MSLIVALAGKDEIVVAADTLGFVGDNGGYYGFECRKLHVIQEKWLLGVAGASIGWDLFSAMNQRHLELGKDFHRAVWDFSNGMHELYQGQEYTGKTFLLLCGIHNGRPLLAEWSFPPRRWREFSSPRMGFHRSGEPRSDVFCFITPFR